MNRTSAPIARQSQAAPVLWMLCVQFLVCEQLARLGWSLPYSFRRNYISDLGATACTPLICSPWHAVMNLSFALQGLLIAGGAMLLWRSKPRPGRFGLALLTICGAGVLLVGFVPENSDMRLHALGAVMHFLGGGLGIMAAGWSLQGRFRWISIVTGLLVVVSTLLLGQQGSPLLARLGVGAVERVAAYGIVFWMVGTGFYLRTTSRTSG